MTVTAKRRDPFDEPTARVSIRLGQAALFGALAGLIALFLIPLSPAVSDALLLVNVAGALIILFLTVTTDDPVKLNTFPSLLLLGTCLRLGLTIGNTRLILNDGEAGHLVRAIGDIVIGGNAATGVTIFAIILIVQFLVVAKGAERVAEVTARFTLDGLPGKQMSIDADLRAGLLTSEEAQTKRRDLTQESRFYGAMDGAMKFIKGETVAGSVILLVSLIGGLVTGVFRYGLSPSRAMEHYATLTVGEGLSAQIPAFLSTLTCGLVVTRVSTPENVTSFGEDVGRQWFRDPNAYAAAGVFIAVMAALPGLPHGLFFACATAFIALAALIRRGQKKARHERLSVERLYLNAGEVRSHSALTAPLLLKISPELSRTFRSHSRWQECFQHLYPELRRYLTKKTGVPYPDLRIETDEALPPHRYQIAIHDVVADEGLIATDHGLVRLNGVTAESGAGAGITTRTAHGSPAILIDWDRRSDWEKRGHAVYAPEDLLLRHISQILLRRASDFIGIQETRSLLSECERLYPELVREVVPRLISLHRLTEIIRRLVEEGVPIRDLRLILETLAGAQPDRKDAVTLTEDVRIGLKRVLSSLVSRHGRTVAAFLLDPNLEQDIADHIRIQDGDCLLTLEPAQIRRIAQTIANTYRAHGYAGPEAIVLTHSGIRRSVRQIIAEDVPEAKVLSFQELDAHLVIDTRDVIGIPHTEGTDV